jgi:hypothetical protein
MKAEKTKGNHCSLLRFTWFLEGSKGVLLKLAKILL